MGFIKEMFLLALHLLGALVFMGFWLIFLFPITLAQIMLYNGPSDTFSTEQRTDDYLLFANFFKTWKY